MKIIKILISEIKNIHIMRFFWPRLFQSQKPEGNFDTYLEAVQQQRREQQQNKIDRSMI